jgi:RNA-directed DNA polymerase
VFSALDDYMWKLLYKWSSGHTEEVQAVEDGPVLRPVQPSRNNWWVFGDKDTGAYLPKFA